MTNALSLASTRRQEASTTARDVWVNARRIGDKAPNATVSDAAGAPIKLGDLWARGPLVLIFHPGEASRYTALQLRKWVEYEDALLQLGATLAVTCLQEHEGTLKAIAATGARFAVLRDTNLYAAYGFGIAVPLLPEIADVYASFATASSIVCANGGHILPAPATYLLDRDGRILYADLAADQGNVEPEDIVAIIQGLRPGE